MPTVRTHENATLTAHRLDPESNTVTGALYDQTGALIAESLRSIGAGDRWSVADPDAAAPLTAVGKYGDGGADLYLQEAVFGGHLFRAWGHLITESLSTAWAAETLPGLPLLLLPWARVPASTVRAGLELLGIAGWGERPMIVTSGDAVIGRVHVPERLVKVDEVVYRNGQIDPRMNQVYDGMAAAARDGKRAPRPVFLARPAGHRRAHPQEAEIMGRLAADGVQLVEAWQHPILEQIRIADCASVLLGFSGSNLHNCVWARQGTPVIEIQDKRAQNRTRTGRRNFQDPLCALRAQPMSYVRGIEAGAPRAMEAILTDTLAALKPALAAD